MLLDLTIIVFVAFCINTGRKKGFLRSLRTGAGTIIALIAGFYFTSPLKTFLIDNTQVDEALMEWFASSVTGVIEGDGSTTSLPQSLESYWSGPAATLIDVVMGTMAFVIILLVVNLIFMIILRKFSTKHSDGTMGTIDSVLGLLFGAAKGVLIVLIFLAVAIPVTTVINPDWALGLYNQLETSFISGYLYAHNPLLNIGVFYEELMSDLIVLP